MPKKRAEPIALSYRFWKKNAQHGHAAFQAKPSGTESAMKYVVHLVLKRSADQALLLWTDRDFAGVFNFGSRVKSAFELS